MQRSTRFSRGPWAAVIAAAALLGCADEAVDDLESTATAQAPIEDGVNDDDHLGVVRVVRPRSLDVPGDKGGQCSGVVVAPNLVLTARHCVSALKPAKSLCDGTTFHPTQTLTVEIVGLSDALDSLSVPAQNVAVPGEGDELCGHDVALLRVPTLVRALRKRGVPIYEPRFESNVRRSESYRAVGLGAYNAKGFGVGTRRERDGLSVDCAGRSCRSEGVGEREWRGSDAICSGDSGGPALDADGRLIGIVSRSNSSDCSKPVYASVYAWRGWLRDEALASARLDGLAPPTWATTTFAEPASAEGEAFGDEGELGGGCAAGAAPPGRGAWALAALVMTAALARRRRVTAR
ncbi:MAG TPA: trypsin-like serine protease [Polyangiaceae bacterium]|nr:trypsin-like serine protease [Polyangiaceae bacterium]